METQKISTGKFAMNYGLALGLIMTAIGVIMYVTGMALEGVQWPQYLYYLIFPIVIYMAISKYKASNGATLSLGDAIKVGLTISIISALIYGAYTLLFNYVIDPEFLGQAMDAAREKVMENNEMTQEQLDQTMEWMEKFSNPALGVAFWVALSGFFGLIYSLIFGLIMKSE
ncbi:MAG: hypothetical protein BM564_09675 [Bacteroidetes bacterium MedPE-SWsnd-G2]|nr:MAG: hypothetical protein BM564_09675 [Bacteroidetes bacterium MedPE-SWsnd-G2]